LHQPTGQWGDEKVIEVQFLEDDRSVQRRSPA
jgi:hypothetical protein